MSEILIKNGLVVTNQQQIKKDIRIKGEKIIEIGNNLVKSSDLTREINAKDMLVFPGGIDPHVHLSLPDNVPEKYRWTDDFESGSKAALAGGITTLGCISVPDKDETPLGTLERETKSILQQAIADFMIHPVILNPTVEKIKEFPQLVKRGCTTIKIFMVTDDFDQNVLDYIEAIKKAKDIGMLSMIHCEDNAMIKYTCKKMATENRTSLAYYADSRPVISEVIATQRAIAISELTGAPIYIVHLSSERALKVCEEAQSRQLPVYVEGRPIFLYLTREEYLKPEGAIFVVQPPLREATDNEALWEGIRNNSISTIATDHAPHAREQKLDPTLNINDLLPGINELQLMLPMFYTNGVKKGRISIEKFVELSSTNSAKLFGLYPEKGTIQVGSDADIVIWDPKEVREINDEDMFSKAGFSIYSGQKLQGWPIITIRRGEIIFQDRKIIAKTGSGRVLRCKKSQSLN